MLFRLLKSYFFGLLISLGVFLIGYIITYWGYSESMAKAFANSFVLKFNGVLIITTGYGALYFAYKTFKGYFHSLIYNMFEIKKKEQAEIYNALQDLWKLRNKQLISFIVFLIGGIILFLCGYPHNGFPKYYLWITSSSLFYVGGLMSSYLVYAIILFKKIENAERKIILQRNTTIIEIENFNFYLTTLFLACIIALYFAFRGTLTADFTFENEGIFGLFNSIESRRLLLFPIIVFLPFVLFSSFYIRYVIRKIYLNSIKRKIKKIDKLSKPFKKKDLEDLSKEQLMNVLQIRATVIDIKEKITQKNKLFPLVSIKDSPSIVLIIIILIQFIYQYDGIIKEFINYIIGA